MRVPSARRILYMCPALGVSGFAGQRREGGYQVAEALSLDHDVLAQQLGRVLTFTGDDGIHYRTVFIEGCLSLIHI